MAELLHQLIRDTAKREPALEALSYKAEVLDYAGLWQQV